MGSEWNSIERRTARTATGVDWNQPYSVDALLALYTNFQRGTRDQFI
jgi:hypothetical protein